MVARPVQISLDEDLLAEIDRDAETLKRGRSAFIRAAVGRYLRAKARRRLDQRIRRAYGGHQEALFDDMGALIGAQAWPKN